MTILTEPNPWRLVATDPPPVGCYVLGANPGQHGTIVIRRASGWRIREMSGDTPTTWIPTLWMEIPTAPMETP